MAIKRFLLFSFIALLIAIAFAIGIFVYVQYEFYKPQEAINIEPIVPTVSSESVGESQQSQPETVTEPATDLEDSPTTVSGIPLRSLPLDDTQKALLGQFNIDYYTFVITPDMITCAKSGIGESRFDEIVAGSAPGFLESLTLFNCTR